MRRFRLLGSLATAAALAVTSLGAAPASADSVCTENNSYKFFGPLNTTDKLGTARISYFLNCTGINYNTTPPSVTQGSGGGGFDYTYDGTCVFAALYNDFFQGYLVGGVVEYEEHTHRLPYGYLKVGVLVPNAPCNQASAVSVETSYNYPKVP